jgi:hypothetical protein
MGNPLDTLNLAAGAEVLPLELLEPLDSSNPASTPVGISGPEQRLTVTPDPGVMGGDGDSAWLPPSQLLIGKDGVTRAIWPVHLAGWQALGWQLLSPASGGDEPVPLDSGDLEPEPPQAPEPAETTSDGGEALLASQPTDFQAMTKAQIVTFCSTVHGVELDGSQTKAELVEQALALEAQASGTDAADLAPWDDALL